VDYYEQYNNALSVPCYSEQVVGIHKLKTIMKDICLFAGLEGRNTNLQIEVVKNMRNSFVSGWHTRARNIKSNWSQKYRSTTALRKYQKASVAILKVVSSKLNPPPPPNVPDMKP
jgi:hypothetical protein